MANRKYSELKVGIFVTIAAIIVIATIFWAKGFTAGINQRELVVYFDNVSGLNDGDPVNVKGVRMGKVRTINLEGDSVKVEFRIDNSVEIKRDYRIMVGMAELMSGKVIEVDPGRSDIEINYDEPLRGTNPTDISQLVTSFSDITDDIKVVMEQFKKSAETLDEVVINVNEIVGDDRLKSEIRSTVSNLEVTSRNLNQLVSENRVAFRDITGKVDVTVENFDAAVVENSREMQNTFRNIQELTVNVDTLINTLNTIASDIKEQRAGFGKFIYDDRFFESMNRTILEIERLTKSIRQDGVKINLDLF